MSFINALLLWKQQESKLLCASASQASACILFSNIPFIKESHMPNPDARSRDVEPFCGGRTCNTLQGQACRKRNNVWPFLQVTTLLSFHPLPLSLLLTPL